MMGFGLPDDNLHAPNEKLHLPNFYRGIEAVADRKSTRLNSSHRCISYAVFCLKKKTRPTQCDHCHSGRDADPRRGHNSAGGWCTGQLHTEWWGPSASPARAGTASLFFFNDTATTEIYTLSLHAALPICRFCRSLWTSSPWWCGRGSMRRLLDRLYGGRPARSIRISPSTKLRRCRT